MYIYINIYIAHIGNWYGRIKIKMEYQGISKGIKLSGSTSLSKKIHVQWMCKQNGKDHRDISQKTYPHES